MPSEATLTPKNSVQDRVQNGTLKSSVLSYEQRSEPPLRLIQIVGAAPELEIGGHSFTTVGVWHHMVKLEETAFGATAVRADEAKGA